MPTMVRNELQLRGPRGHVIRFLSQVKGVVGGEEKFFDFEKLIPIPKKDPRKWRISHWGTEWNAVDPQVFISIDDGDFIATIHFGTAYNHPRSIIEKVIDLTKDWVISVYFAYAQEFCEDVGEYVDSAWKEYSPDSEDAERIYTFLFGFSPEDEEGDKKISK